MNPITFILAILAEKKVLNAKEVKELYHAGINQTTNNSLPQMLAKVRTAIEKANTTPIGTVPVVDAKDFLKSRNTIEQ